MFQIYCVLSNFYTLEEVTPNAHRLAAVTLITIEVFGKRGPPQQYVLEDQHVQPVE
jgi:hypothetical protein